MVMKGSKMERQTSEQYQSFYKEELSINDPEAIIHEMTSAERAEYRQILMDEVNDKVQQVLLINRLEFAQNEQ